MSISILALKCYIRGWHCHSAVRYCSCLLDPVGKVVTCSLVSGVLDQDCQQAHCILGSVV